MGPAPRGYLLAILAAAVLACGCSDDDPVDPGGGGLPAGQVPDFALVDVNETSTTFDQAVSPRDYLQKVSAWYFGYAT